MAKFKSNSGRKVCQGDHFLKILFGCIRPIPESKNLLPLRANSSL